MVLDRRDWPMCPHGMLRSRGWRAIVELYVASQVSPLTRWPEAYPAWVVDGMTALHGALKAEESRQIKAVTSGPRNAPPRSSGRRSAGAV